MIRCGAAATASPGTASRQTRRSDAMTSDHRVNRASWRDHDCLTSSHRKNGPPMSAVTMPTGSSSGAIDGPRQQVAQHQKGGAEERRGRQHDAVIRSHHQAHQVRHDDADEAHRSAQRDRGAGGQRGAEERPALRALHFDAAAGGHVLAHGQQIQRPRQHGEHDERRDDERQGRDDRTVAADVQIAHQPAHRAERLREIAEVLDEQDQRREERVQRDAGQQQHVGGQTAPSATRPASRRWRSPTSEPRKLAIGTDETPSAPRPTRR